MLESARNHSVLVIGLILGLGTLGLYAPLLHNGFIAYDDTGYITDNPMVTRGVSWPGIVWAFSSFEQGNWHPLTWISHMLDCQFFGLNPAGHHLTNALLHTLNTVLVFFLLRRMTGNVWPSAFVAALFGWHPLHVESVAWASERKDVLCALFWLLTMMAYVSSIKKPRPSRYILALGLFACSLMSKPMAVTLPFVLLLVDFWPLNRWSPSAEISPAEPASGTSPALRTSPIWWRRGVFLILEKSPFFLLILVDCWVTYVAQKNVGAMPPVTALPFSYRLANAFWSYLRYISNTLCPAGLSLIYPYKAHLPLALVGISIGLLVIWSVLFWMWRRRFPYLLTGWFWFLGTLVPTIGLIQVGAQSMADRYMYIPSIGLFVLVVWGLNDLMHFYPRWQTAVRIVGVAALAGCLVATSLQIRYWQNTVRLFTHAVEVTGDNGVAYYCLGLDCEKHGNHAAALDLYQRSVDAAPDYYPAQYGLGSMLLEKGDFSKARPHLDSAEKLHPHDPELEFDLGMILLKADKNRESVDHLRSAVQFAPDNPKYHTYLGCALETITNYNAAMEQFSNALALQPDFSYARYVLAEALTATGRTNEAIAQYKAEVRQHGDDPQAHYNLGLALLDDQQCAAAQAEFELESRLAPNEIRAHYRLAQALAGEGEFAAAAAQYHIVLQTLPNFSDAKHELASLLAAHPELK